MRPYYSPEERPTKHIRVLMNAAYQTGVETPGDVRTALDVVDRWLKDAGLPSRQGDPMKLTDLDRVIEVLQEAETEATHGKTANPIVIDLRVEEALTLLRSMRERAVEVALEGWVDREVSGAGMWFMESAHAVNPVPALLIITPEEGGNDGDE